MARHHFSRALMLGPLLLKVERKGPDSGPVLTATRDGAAVELARTKREARALFAALTALAREELPE